MCRAGLGPTKGTATRPLPAGLQGGCGVSPSLCQHSSASSQPGGGPAPLAWTPTQPSMKTPGKMLAGDRSCWGQERPSRDTVVKSRSVQSSPRTGDLHCPLLTGWLKRDRVPSQAMAGREAGTTEAGSGAGGTRDREGSLLPGPAPVSKKSLSPFLWP